MLFSIIPWFLSLVVFFPIVGAGFFGADLDAGPLPAIGNLILHLIYGAVLGSMYTVPDRSLADSERTTDEWHDDRVGWRPLDRHYRWIGSGNLRCRHDGQRDGDAADRCRLGNDGRCDCRSPDRSVGRRTDGYTSSTRAAAGLGSVAQVLTLGG